MGNEYWRQIETAAVYRGARQKKELHTWEKIAVAIGYFDNIKARYRDLLGDSDEMNDVARQCADVVTKNTCGQWYENPGRAAAWALRGRSDKDKAFRLIFIADPFVLMNDCELARHLVDRIPAASKKKMIDRVCRAEERRLQRRVGPGQEPSERQWSKASLRVHRKVDAKLRHWYRGRVNSARRELLRFILGKPKRKAKARNSSSSHG